MDIIVEEGKIRIKLSEHLSAEPLEMVLVERAGLVGKNGEVVKWCDQNGTFLTSSMEKVKIEGTTAQAVERADVLKYVARKLSPRLVVTMNAKNDGDTLMEVWKLPDPWAAFTTMRQYAKYAAASHQYGYDHDITRGVWDLALRIHSGAEQISLSLTKMTSKSFDVPLARVITTLSNGVSGLARYISRNESTLTAADFRSFAVPPSSRVESVKPISGSVVRFILKEFHQAKLLKWNGIIYVIERDDLKKVGFHACDLCFVEGSSFPNVMAWADKSCKTAATHPNIGSGGSVCLGDLRGSDSSMPTLGDFIKMMTMMNFDSSYWGRIEFSRILQHPEPGVDTWDRMPGLRILRDTTSNTIL